MGFVESNLKYDLNLSKGISRYTISFYQAIKSCMQGADEVSDGSAHVARFVFRRETSGLLGAMRRLIMGYIIASQLSVMMQIPASISSIVNFVVPSFLATRMQDLWMMNPKCFVFVLASLSFLLYRCYPIPSQEESLLVMRSLGVQTTSRGSSRFIPKDEVRHFRRDPIEAHLHRYKT